ncbi:GNAT family N-acetyltransferase [Wukongibacter baidiensis]|uniref:GNAT family N-acetyltransferase n=1 Tax=Wukongibacter baidiensis TaxID=1723361 RepID=UPI003D7F3A54
MIELLNKEMYYLRPLCKGKKNIDLWSCIEGKMGKAWVDSKKDPTIAIVVVADFCHLLGSIKDKRDETKISGLLDKCKRKIIVADDVSWVSILEKYYPNSFKRFSRFSIKREPDIFQKNILNDFISAVEQEFKIQRIDEVLYYKVIEDKFMADCCSNFSSLKEFLKYGMGYVIVHNEEIISGASSYSSCEGFIDITIGTKEEYRQKGLALACASKLILECLEKNIYPVWDAVDLRSVALAEKLGYHLDKEYEVYSIS